MFIPRKTTGDELDGSFERAKGKESMELNRVDFVNEVFCLEKNQTKIDLVSIVMYNV
jgi:hypothetical protein